MGLLVSWHLRDLRTELYVASTRTDLQASHGTVEDIYRFEGLYGMKSFMAIAAVYSLSDRGYLKWKITV